MEKVLVTGGCGFIGSHLVDKLIENGYDVIVLDNLDKQVHPDGIPEYINLKARYIFEDIRKKQELRKIIKEVDYIFHFAAKVGVGQSQYQIEEYVDVNIRGTANLLDVLVNTKNKVKKLIIASSMSIYGEGLYKCKKCGDVKPELRNFEEKKIDDWEPKCPFCNNEIVPCPTPETLPLKSNSIYAISKKEQEEMSLLIGKTYKIPVVSLRFFNVYGPRQTLSNPYTGVCAIFLSRIKNNNPPVIFEDGLQTRDFIWIEDVVDACILSMKKEEADYEIFNVGSGKATSILEIANLLIKLFGKDIKPEITYKFRKGDIRHCYADINKIRNKLGFEPKTTLEEGLKKLITWAKEVKAEDKFEKAHRELKKKGLV
ncbi:MAG: SDR family NAD(P)-dependent oxidoreductase [Candidatus Omnitrophica bacterium]|nr:SDR family NAD(P)-dependent oxidoreductase [Candidatus Omnitrophota bacterium]MCM8807457.1 SDR family NAD(P)-dependent oxidoreductase [Candidatus Omnitrophota bacterium]